MSDGDAGKECGSCSGSGYTQAISMSWTDDQLEEFECPHCDSGWIFEETPTEEKL